MQAGGLRQAPGFRLDYGAMAYPVLNSWVVTLGFAAGLIAGCSGGSKAAADGGPDSGGSAAIPAGVTSCQAYCDTAIASLCAPPLYESIEECRTVKCADLATAPAQCQAMLKAYYDCKRTQPDICEDSGCTSQANAFNDCTNAAIGP